MFRNLLRVSGTCGAPAEASKVSFQPRQSHAATQHRRRLSDSCNTPSHNTAIHPTSTNQMDRYPTNCDQLPQSMVGPLCDASDGTPTFAALHRDGNILKFRARAAWRLELHDAASQGQEIRWPNYVHSVSVHTCTSTASRRAPNSSNPHHSQPTNQRHRTTDTRRAIHSTRLQQTQGSPPLLTALSQRDGPLTGRRGASHAGGMALGPGWDGLDWTDVPLFACAGVGASRRFFVLGCVAAAAAAATSEGNGRWMDGWK